MLIPKGITKKQLIIYSSIIIVMILSIIILLYMSYGSGENNNSDFNLPTTLDGIAVDQNQSLIKNLNTLDLSIFDNLKLKNLKEILIKRSGNISAGKENPFAPAKE